ncbi:hypothetical protein BS50DRAFT_349347 [Corynespora cassiicola Philippines]|uniref:Uncharacterized protein n=1 Tax=Corynespora cassiicola Philippines TaxID=1448308 RepID=A0A2T2NQU2_CORCC|nr:hypothetical protein BS50DRAFT_349347 [Corynespora cassiicola Philippines]
MSWSPTGGGKMLCSHQIHLYLSNLICGISWGWRAAASHFNSSRLQHEYRTSMELQQSLAWLYVIATCCFAAHNVSRVISMKPSKKCFTIASVDCSTG